MKNLKNKFNPLQKLEISKRLCLFPESFQKLKFVNKS